MEDIHNIFYPKPMLHDNKENTHNYNLNDKLTDKLTDKPETNQGCLELFVEDQEEALMMKTKHRWNHNSLQNFTLTLHPCDLS